MMFNERDLIARLEAADTDELAQMVARPARDEEKSLRTYLGDERYQRLHSLALRREMMQNLRVGQRRAEKQRRANKDTSKDKTTKQSHNVIIIPGVLGSELTSYDKNGNAERIWLNPRRIVMGDMTRLRLDANGLNEYDPRYVVRATGIMKRYYGELMLTLGVNWNVHAFWYDWRKDMKITAAQLHARINALFPSDDPVHIVAHSVGGLVVRTYLANYDQNWKRIGRLIMLGTPNHGLYTAPLALTGQLDLVRWIDQLDPHHEMAEIQEIISSFPGFYQLLPSPYRDKKIEARYLNTLYKADHYKPLKVSEQHLELARKHHEGLQEVVNPHRMVYIGGYDQPTIVDLDADKLVFDNDDPDNNGPLKRAMRVGLDGDGSVPHELGMLYTKKPKQQVPAFFLRTDHGLLNSHPRVLAAIDALLKLDIPTEPAAPTEFKELSKKLKEIEQSTDLYLSLTNDERPDNERPDTTGHTKNQPDPRRKLIDESKENARELDATAKTLTRGNDAERTFITAEDRSIEELLTRGFMVGNDKDRLRELDLPLKPPTININLEHGDLTELNLTDEMDVMAIGHYRGTQPKDLLRKVDEALSRAQNGGDLVCDHEGNPLESELLLSQFAQRGTIRAELADIFLFNDPSFLKGRTIAIVGKGVPGRFSAPELTVLVRELCWTLGRLGKKHLVTVLIGAGRETASISDAVSAWIRGIKYAITGIAKTDQHQLESITFMEIDPESVKQIDSALSQQRNSLQKKNRIRLVYKKITKEERSALDKVVKPIQSKPLASEQQDEPTAQRHDELKPMRVTVGLEGGTYVFGAVSSTASIPEREIPLDPNLVTQANDEIAAEGNPERQLQLGQFMERLLIPHDLRNLFTTPSPIVMTVDAATARIHWEMLAQTDPLGISGQESDIDDRNQSFLGISRGFTRQLRTRFAPLPHPPPPAQRLLRVLVVADPAEDAHLPGAEEEGVAVADLFEHFNVVHAVKRNRVEVVRLFGPREATRTAVLRQLMMRSYDLLHFAGHCLYDKKNPSASGWIFSNGERISANELRRIDRVPMFIFSNACESGITPDRASERSIDLAPSFAEAFFAQGVANFVCTAWPVDDRAARDFALTLYAGLLGLDGDGTKLNTKPRLISIDLDECKASSPKPIFMAMRNARNAIAVPPNDLRTWGAYQHYGDPYFCLFDSSEWNKNGDEQKPRPKSATPAPKEKPLEAAPLASNKERIEESNGSSGMEG